MADPVSIAALSTGAALNIAQSIIMGRFADKVSKKQSAETIKSGKSRADLLRARSRRLAGAQRAKMAASGMDLSGSALDVLMDSAMQYDLQAITEEYMANREAQSIRMSGKMSRRAGIFQGISTGLEYAGLASLVSGAMGGTPTFG